jgi:enterochelin esterase-like enzyme
MKSRTSRCLTCLLGALLLSALVVPSSAQKATSKEAAARKPIKVDPTIYDAYVGQYELFPKMQLSLRRHRQRLIAQISGQPPFEVFPESESKFFWKIVDAQFTIQKDKEGNITGLLFEQGGLNRTAKKISNDPSQGEAKEPEVTLESPRLAALAKELKSGTKAALARFWQEIQDKAPLLETIATDAGHVWVTFVWRGTEKTRGVVLNGGLSSAKDKVLAQLEGTDLWYLTERIPRDARFSYHFEINRPAKVPADLASQMRLMSQCPPLLDPLNPRDVTVQGMLASLVELPGAPPQPWLKRLPGVPEGKLSAHKIKSEVLKQERAFTVYTPANYDPKGEPCGLLVLFDGPFYESADEIPGPVILDNLIAKKKVPPLVAVFVKHIDRNKELGFSDPFADFLAKELAPWLRKNYSVSADPARTIAGGLSLGGAMASFCALRYPEVFGNVLSQSGAYQWYPGAFDAMLKGTPPDTSQIGWLTRRFVAIPRRPVRFYLEAGRFEDGFPESLLAENRRFRDVLEAKGYTVHYSEFSGGHDYVTWRGTFADGLMALTGISEKK